MAALAQYHKIYKNGVTQKSDWSQAKARPIIEMY
jgi:hypothetical protein